MNTLTPKDILKLAEAGDYYAGKFLELEDLILHGDSIDSNMLPLLCELNALPGIQTIASCGGHAEPRENQHSEDEWFVSFDVLPGEYTSLLRLVEKFAGGATGFIRLEVTWAGGHFDMLSCILRGDESDPIELASRLRGLTWHDFRSGKGAIFEG